MNRDEIIHQARLKYIIKNNITNNISEAVKLYIDNDLNAIEKIDYKISSPSIHKVAKILKNKRPECDECGNELYMSINARSPENILYPVAWHCKKCGMIYYSNKKIEDWQRLLNNENI